MIVGKKTKRFIKYYPKEHYSTFFNQKTGLFIRQEDKGFKEPFWSRHGPELLDISITNYCKNKCFFCYRNTNINGSFMSIKELEIILKQAYKMDVKQIALGGGNPNEHPEFIKILKIIRIKYNIVPSYTTNGSGLTNDIIKATKKYCGVIAISLQKFNNTLYKLFNILYKQKITTNIHFVVTSESIIDAIDILNGNKKLPQGINAIIFLNYKPVGNNKNDNLKANKSKLINKFFKLIKEKKISCKIGFDSCFISGICKYMNISPIFYDFCEAGRFSAFIDEKLNMMPCSFMIENKNKESLKEKTMLEIWQKSYIFSNFREQIKQNKCNCKKNDFCFGGCPVFDINFCF